ncbi:hypothetical protein [Mycobacterium sp. 1423905.2]|uniref:hypothetical protein n=1 Tax=Mycobacterium sp. 1423905.2 TaxID=1856859 RepID=UPI0007FE1F28|nr:hypothetical protein [Mycobacterium sp. 1423905.2]OBJ49539.1 hypothetical protein A9W95_25580 [Mycobacterium sp. 1423905.2]
MPDSPDTFDSSRVDSSGLPPLTAAIRDTWLRETGFSGAIYPVPLETTMRRILDAIHSLETRVIALESAD